jgi:hypothetical protein
MANTLNYLFSLIPVLQARFLTPQVNATANVEVWKVSHHFQPGIYDALESSAEIRLPISDVNDGHSGSQRASLSPNETQE